MVPLNRRQFLQTGGIALTAFAGCAGRSVGDDPMEGTETGTAQTTSEAPLDDVELAATPLADGFTSPVDVAVPRAEEFWVVDQVGQVYFIESADADPQVAVDVTDRMVELSGFEERGLLGIAFHPDFDGDGRVFLRYSAPRRAGTPDNYSHTFVLSEFEASSGTIDLESERTILEIPEPQSNHNAGSVTFGPDGFLYVGVGDGGAGNDQGRGHVEDWYDGVDGGNGQDVTENLLGSVLRIDVDSEGEDGRPYAIPQDNPLVGTDGLSEQFAWGLRNPWRFSFGPEGRFFVADVGQSEWEEVSLVERGGNYGWNVREGANCFKAEECPTETPDGDPLVDPIIQYPHDGGDVSGVSVIGGHLYDGADVPALQGRYVFADWQSRGNLFVATDRGEDRWPVTAVPVEGDGLGSNVLSFGRTTAGELLVCTTAEGGLSGSTGAVHRLRSA